jgi:hypothetical protein
MELIDCSLKDSQLLVELVSNSIIKIEENIITVINK